MTLPNTTSIGYGYDAYQNLASVTYADGTTKEYFYGDVRNRFLLTGIEDESNGLFATYNYDANGRVASESHAGGVNATATRSRKPSTISPRTSPGRRPTPTPRWAKCRRSTAHAAT